MAWIEGHSGDRTKDSPSTETNHTARVTLAPFRSSRVQADW